MSIGPSARDLFLSPSALHHGDACRLETVKQVVASLGTRRTLSVARCSTTYTFSEELNYIILISVPSRYVRFSVRTERSITITVVGF